MKIAWKKVGLAAVLGLGGGQAFARLRDRPDLVLPILQVSAASGVVGGLVGWGVSTYRKLPPHLHTLSLAANFAVVSGTFLSIRTVLHTAPFEGGSPSGTRPSSSQYLSNSPSLTHYISSGTSGGITGALTSIVSRYGLRSILLTSLGGMGMGLCAQAGYTLLLNWRRKKAIQLYYQDMGRERPSRFEKWTFDNFEARFLGFWHQKAESIEVEIEVLSLETAISEEKQKLDKMLSEEGVNSSDNEIVTSSSGSEMSVERSMMSL